MKKIFVALFALFLILGFTTVNAEETETPIVEETEQDFIVWASENLEPVIAFLRAGGWTLVIIVMAKSISLIKQGKLVKVDDLIKKHGSNLFETLFKSPELFALMFDRLKETTQGKQILDTVNHSKETLLLELEGKLIEWENKIELDIFANDDARKKAEAYLRKLVEEYENINRI